MKAGYVRTDDEMLTVGREVEAKVCHLGPHGRRLGFLKATVKSVNDNGTFGIRYKGLIPDFDVRQGYAGLLD